MTNKTSISTTNNKKNNRELSSVLVDFLLSIVFLMITIAISFFIEEYIPYSTITYGTKLSAIILLVLYSLCRLIKTIPFLQVFLHIIATSVYLLILHLTTGVLSETVNLVFIVIYCVLLMIYSLKVVIKPRKDKIDIFLISLAVIINYVVSLAFFFLSESHNSASDVPQQLLINIFIAFLAYFIARQLRTLDINYMHSIKAASIPVSRIKKQNYRTLVLIVLGFSIALLGVSFIPSDIMLSKITFDGPDIEQFSEPYWEPEVIQTTDLGEVETSDLAPIFQTFQFTIGFLALSVAIYGLFNLVKYLRNKLTPTPNRPYSYNSEAVIDEIEKINSRTGGTDFLHKSADFGKGYERSVRKRFYTAAKRAISKGADISNSDTPRQINSKIGQVLEPIDDLTSEYEKVRYDNRT